MTVNIDNHFECIIQSLRWTCDEHLRQTMAENHPDETQHLLTRALRLLVQLSLKDYPGRDHIIKELALIAQQLSDDSNDSKEFGSLLKDSLDNYHLVFTQHQQGICETGECHKQYIPPCQQACPSHIDIAEFLSEIGQHHFTQATKTIRQSNPLPYSCGLVCPAPCENNCMRMATDKSINIKLMKAYTAQKTIDRDKNYPLAIAAKPDNKQIAIIGSGPAGLSAAYYLTLLGHQVSIYEAKQEVGGMLRYGIPDYRLPMDILSHEIREIKRLGVKMLTHHPIKDLEALRSEVDAVFISIGVQASRKIPLQGADLSFVSGGVEFLHQISQGNPVEIGEKIAVIGGGNVAIDVALTALRSGGKQVHLFCLEDRDHMPASKSEIEQALDEGVIIHNAWGPASIEDAGEESQRQANFYKCLSLFDAHGQFSPQFDKQQIHSEIIDNVFLAIGQTIKYLSPAKLQEKLKPILLKRNFINADEQTLQTSLPGVFAGGDAFSGPRTVLEAIQTGKQGAYSIDAFINDKPFNWDSYTIPENSPHSDKVILPSSLEKRALTQRAIVPEISVEQRVNNFSQVELGLSDQQADNESLRCLRCDECIGCGLCELACIDMGINALHFKATDSNRLAIVDLLKVQEKCIACGACTQVCPTGAMRFKDEDNIRSLMFTGTVISTSPLIECEQCHVVLYSQDFSQKVSAEKYHTEHEKVHLCPKCKRDKEARLILSEHC